jgi:hypothetical protein
MRWLLIHGFLSFLIFFVSTYVIFSQSARKEVEAVRCAYPPKIDGSLDDEIWKSAAPAKDFIQYNPYNGKPPSQPTKVRILYDDRALPVFRIGHPFSKFAVNYVHYLFLGWVVF